MQWISIIKNPIKTHKIKSNNNYKEILDEIHANEDPEENIQTRPPKDEHIKLRCVWVIEAYPPSKIKSLINAIKIFGWNKTDHPMLTTDVISWITNSREHSNIYPYDLGYIAPKGKSKFTPYRPAPMPEGISGAHGSLLNILPSTTLFVMQFILDEKNESILEKPLLESYSTYLKKLTNNHQVYMNPAHQKEESIINERQKLYKKCYEWFISNAPGVFASGIDNGEFPTCEFITLDVGVPFERVEKKNSYLNYINLLDLKAFHEQWQSDQLSGVKLAISPDRETGRSKLIISGKTSDVLKNSLEAYGGRTTNGFASYLTDIHKTLGIWSLYLLLNSYESQLSKLRDSLIKVEVQNIKRGLKELRRIDKSVIQFENDIPSFAFELERYCNNINRFQRDIYDFKPVHSWQGEDDLLELIRKRILEKTIPIKETKDNLIKAISTTSQIITSKSNEKVSKTNFRMTIALLLFTVIIVFIEIIVNWNDIFCFFQ